MRRCSWSTLLTCAMHRLATEVADRLGPVSFLMNNAGIGGGGDALS